MRRILLPAFVILCRRTDAVRQGIVHLSGLQQELSQNDDDNKDEAPASSIVMIVSAAVAGRRFRDVAQQTHCAVNGKNIFQHDVSLLSRAGCCARPDFQYGFRQFHVRSAIWRPRVDTIRPRPQKNEVLCVKYSERAGRTLFFCSGQTLKILLNNLKNIVLML